MSFQEYADSLKSRLRTGDVSPTLAIGIAVLVIAVVVVAAFSVGALLLDGKADEAEAQETGFSLSSAFEEAAREEERSSICVHVSGEVASPGICYLEEGARVADAIDAVGGMLPSAAADALNLARPLEDGEQIIVISKEEQARALEAAGAAEAAPPSAPSPSAGNGSSPNASAGAAITSSGKVNINAATSAELQTLSGIGQSKAEKIIAYRESSGPFKSVDDLTKVSGIGDKTLEAIRDAICV